MEAPMDFDLCDWIVTCSADGGKTWRSEAFRRVESAREYLRFAVDEHAGDDGFSYFVELKVLVNPADLLDDSVPESHIRLVTGRRVMGAGPVADAG